MASPPKIEDGSVIRFTVYCYCPGDAQAGLMVLHYVQDNHAVDGVNAVEAAESLKTALTATLPAVMSNEAEFQGVICQVYQTATDKITFSGLSTTGAVVGAVVQPMVPGQVTALIRKRGVMSGASNRGRAYVPFLPVTFITGAGSLTVAALGALTALKNVMAGTLAMTGAGGTANASPVLAHHGMLPLTYTEVSTMTVSTKVATQKRRGDFGRVNAAFGG